MVDNWLVLGLVVLGSTILFIGFLWLAAHAANWIYSVTIQKMKKRDDIAAFWYGVILGFAIGALVL